MSIQSEIDRISANVQSSLDVIRNAGVEVPTPSSSNDLPTLTEKMAGEKQDKLTGKQGQVVGFDSQGNAQAQDPPSGGSGKRTCRFVVGTSTAGWTANDCDYLCDGTADDVEINAAIQALPSTGGEIVILDGTYNITATIAMNKNNVTLSGNGAATVLKCMWNSSRDDGVITVVASSGCCVKEVCVDGNNSSYNRSYNYGCSCRTSTKSIIINNIFINNYYGVYLINSNEIIISNNTCINNSDSGIYMVGNNVKTVLYNIISENNCVENGTGITLKRVIGGLVTCNMVKENMTGISIEVSDNCVVASNIAIRGNGTPSEYSSDQYTIIADKNSANNLIIGNNIMGKNYVDGGTNNTWANNKYQ